MIERDTFESRYQNLSDAWDSHQRLRALGAPLRSLADSSARLDRARSAMWDWHRCHIARAR